MGQPQPHHLRPTRCLLGRLMRRRCRAAACGSTVRLGGDHGVFAPSGAVTTTTDQARAQRTSLDTTERPVPGLEMFKLARSRVPMKTSIRQNLFLSFAYNVAGVPLACRRALPVLRAHSHRRGGRSHGAVVGQCHRQLTALAQGESGLRCRNARRAAYLPGWAAGGVIHCCRHIMWSIIICCMLTYWSIMYWRCRTCSGVSFE